MKLNEKLKLRQADGLRYRLRALSGKKIGSGMQFRVVEDIEKTKVIKVPLNRYYIALKVRGRKSSEKVSLKDAIRNADYYCNTRTICSRVIKRYGKLKCLTNSKILNNGLVIQNKVDPLPHRLYNGTEAISSTQVERYCRGIVDINFYLWKLGVGEITLGLDKYGLSSDDELVLYDPFEMTDCKDDLLFLLRARWWRQTNRLLHPHYRAVIDSVFSEQITEDNLTAFFYEHSTSPYQRDTRIEPIRQFSKERSS